MTCLSCFPDKRMNKKQYYFGLALIIAGSILTYLAGEMLRPEEAFQTPLAWVLLGAGGILLILGLVFSLKELIKSVVKRLKAARQRNKLSLDRQHQALQNKDDSVSR